MVSQKVWLQSSLLTRHLEIVDPPEKAPCIGLLTHATLQSPGYPVSLFRILHCNRAEKNMTIVSLTKFIRCVLAFTRTKLVDQQDKRVISLHHQFSSYQNRSIEYLSFLLVQPFDGNALNVCILYVNPLQGTVFASVKPERNVSSTCVNGKFELGLRYNWASIKSLAF